MKTIVSILALALILTGCGKDTPPQASWNGAIHRTDGKNIPFRVFIELQSDKPSATFVIGTERVPVPEVQHQADSLVFLFSEYNAAMRGILDGDTWTGNYLRYRKSTIAVPFSAKAEPAQLTAPISANHSAVPLVGKFQAYLKDGDKIDSTTLATFWTSHDSIFGTLIAPDGDYGLNAGTQQGTSVTLSRFTGWQAQLFEFSQNGPSWQGMFYVRDEAPEMLTLEPRPALEEKIASSRETRIKDPRLPFVFSGITIDGDTLTNDSPRFKGKALIVDIMGTWCHNCMDESPLLQQLYQEYGTKGLQVVGLSFEINDNTDQAKKNLSLYRKRFGITFPLLFCGSTEEKYVGPALKQQMVNFYAYPTALFIDRRGRVESIHVGFKGPGAGEEFQSEVKHLYDVVRRLTGA